MTNQHTHNHSTIELVKIMLIDNRKYEGNPGDKAFLMKSCACGNKIAFDYGGTKEMQSKLTNLNQERE